VIPNHVFLCLVGTFISLYHPYNKSQPAAPGVKARVCLRPEPLD
jgi:hypothetical protein